MPSATPRRPCLVSRLASRDCSSIKNALRSLIGGFVGSDVEIEADDEDERSAVRTMCECGSVTTQLPLCVSQTLLFPRAARKVRELVSDRRGEDEEGRLRRQSKRTR